MSGKDEPETLRYAILLNSSMGVDGGHKRPTTFSAFLTTSPNAEVMAVRPKKMPVIPTSPDDWQTWLTAPWGDAAKMQRALPDGSLRQV
jgi:putative SOS response-associated peptidase YedK